jgi:hypothetical protein
MKDAITLLHKEPMLGGIHNKMDCPLTRVGFLMLKIARGSLGLVGARGFNFIGRGGANIGRKNGPSPILKGVFRNLG